MIIPSTMDHAALRAAAKELSALYPAIGVSVLGHSVCGREIFMFSAGNKSAEKSVLYVGTHHATEYITAAVLVRFLADLGEAAKDGRSVCRVDVRRMLGRRRIYVVPMLNPDGVELHLHGIRDGCPLADRLTAMSGNLSYGEATPRSGDFSYGEATPRSGDFSYGEATTRSGEFPHGEATTRSEDLPRSGGFLHWQANARGVDLNHNYDARWGEYKAVEAERGIVAGATLYSGVSPESEPETQAICALLRYDASVRTVLSLHTQGEVIYYGRHAGERESGGESAPVGARSIGRTLSRMTGYALEETEGTAAYGGLVDWYVREFGRPGYTLECGRGENPLPAEQAVAIYARVREALFCTPYLV